jgi:hypothetical protein
VSPEFPSDNPELWRLRCPTVAPEKALEAEADSVVEIVDFTDADFAVVDCEPIATPEALPPARDAFQTFVDALTQVALAAGAPARVVEALPGMLGAARLDVHRLDASTVDTLVHADLLSRTESGTVARSESLVVNAQAWRATLLGEQSTLAVSSTLDDWSAYIVSALAAAPEKKEALRRQLRTHGIAAFGMIVEAA